jgi:hypothetical protein
VIWRFFVNYYFSLPIILGLWLALKKRATTWLIMLLLAGFLLSCVYPAFLTRYYAAYLPVIVLLILEGLHVIQRWRPGDRPVGVFLALALGVLASCSSLRNVEWFLQSRRIERVQPIRSLVEKQLLSIPGQHLVMVRYAPNHGFYDEWIYNEADIDSARIVWAREINPEEDSALIRYYPSRSVWHVDADARPLRAVPSQQPRGTPMAGDSIH